MIDGTTWSPEIRKKEVEALEAITKAEAEAYELIEEFLREYEEEVAVQLTRIYCAQAVVDFDSDPFAREYMLTNADAMAKDHRLLERLSSSRSS